VLRYYEYPSVNLEELREITHSRYPDRESNQASPEHEPESLPLEQTCSVACSQASSGWRGWVHATDPSFWWEAHWTSKRNTCGHYGFRTLFQSGPGLGLCFEKLQVYPSLFRDSIPALFAFVSVLVLHYVTFRELQFLSPFFFIQLHMKWPLWSKSSHRSPLSDR
jgi:hypothetical protein